MPATAPTFGENEPRAPDSGPGAEAAASHERSGEDVFPETQVDEEHPESIAIDLDTEDMVGYNFHSNNCDNQVLNIVAYNNIYEQ